MYVSYVLMDVVYIHCTVSHSMYSRILLELLYNIYIYVTEFDKTRLRRTKLR